MEKWSTPRSKDSASWFIRVGSCSRDDGKTIKRKAADWNSLQTAAFIKGTMETGNLKGKDVTHGAMEKSTRDNGGRARGTDLESG
jgi:hypothetical protein